MGIKLIFESKLYIVEKDQSTLPNDDEVSLETLPNVNIRDPSHDKNLPIIKDNNFTVFFFVFFLRHCLKICC